MCHISLCQVFADSYRYNASIIPFEENSLAHASDGTPLEDSLGNDIISVAFLKGGGLDDTVALSDDEDLGRVALLYGSGMECAKTAIFVENSCANTLCVG